MPIRAATACWRSGRCCFCCSRAGNRQSVWLAAGTTVACAAAAGSAGRYPRHIHVAAALGLDLCHLAVARASGGRDAFVSRAFHGARRIALVCAALAALISVTLLVCGGLYTASEERLSYANLPAGPPAHSLYPQLAGLATPGPYLPEIDELLRYAEANIPFIDGLVLVPGEEPFFFVTGRVARFPVPFSIRPLTLTRPLRLPRWCSRGTSAG